MHRPHGDDDPRQLLGRGWLLAKHQADLVEQAVFLLGVARPARGHHVLPGVLAAAASGNDVVDVLGVGTAVLAPVTVAGEHSPTVQRRPGAERDLYEVREANHRGHGERGPFRVQLLVGGVQDLGLLLQHEHHRPPNGHDAQRLVGRVEHQRLGHGSVPGARRWWHAHGSRGLQERARTSGSPGDAGVLPTPVQVGDDVHGLRLLGRVAVLRVQAEAEVLGIGHRQQRPPAPPSRPCQSGNLRQGCGPQSGPRHDGDTDPPPPAPAHPGSRTPRQPTAAAPTNGPFSPSPTGTMRAPLENSSRARASSSDWAAAKNGSPKPRATDPPTTANRRSRRLTTDATARPTSVPVRTMVPASASAAGRPVTAAIAGPDASASRHPWPPHAHARPSGSTITWPMWPALPDSPSSSRPSSTMPPPTPVETTMAMKSSTSAAAPRQPSPSASAFASLSTNVGSPVASASRERKGKRRHPGMFSGETSSPPRVIG